MEQQDGGWKQTSFWEATMKMIVNGTFQPATARVNLPQERTRCTAVSKMENTIKHG